MTDTILKSIAVFLISMLPFVESKAAILVARLWHMSFLLSGILCAIGSYIPVLVLLYNKKDHHLRLPKKLQTMPPKLQKYVEKYGCWALLVAISLPFTGMGCWLSAIIARVTNMKKTPAAICIFIGNVIAIILMTGCIHGIVTAIEHLLGLI